MRTDVMVERGDLDGYAVRKRVLKAVEELLRVEDAKQIVGRCV